LVFGLVRKLQGTEAKISGLDVQKNNSAQGSPDGFMSFRCKKESYVDHVLLCSCFKRDITKTELILTVLPCTNVNLTRNTRHAFSDQMLSVKKEFIKSRSDLQ
jgi:hypothetical protein